MIKLTVLKNDDGDESNDLIMIMVVMMIHTDDKK